MQTLCTIKKQIYPIHKTTRVSITSKEVNDCNIKLFRLLRNNGTSLYSYTFTEILQDYMWSKVKGTIEGRCVEEGLALRSTDRDVNVQKSLFLVVAEHLNTNMVGTLNYTVRVFAPNVDDSVLLKVVEKCNLGLKTHLVPFISSEIVDAFPVHKPDLFSDKTLDLSASVPQFRSFPVEVLLPLRLHSSEKAQELESLVEGDLLFAVVKGRRNEIFDRQLSIVAVFDCLYVTKVQMDSIKAKLDEGDREDEKNDVEELFVDRH